MELVSPAGNLEKLRYAAIYGADAIYASGKNFGLRAKSENFDQEELSQAVDFIHSLAKKIYITVNIYPHNEHLEALPEYLKFLEAIQVDALIISDPGIFKMAQEMVPHIPVHISTQANVTSWKAASFWYDLGVKRIILARELSRDEITFIKKKLPNLELEIFVHGAMCISYSGRCLLSDYLAGRSANLGNCTQPCRWQYSLVEATRPDQQFSILEDENGSYILNSRDLCLFDRLEEIIQCGIDSIKIEGRMKSLYYVANLSRTYRKALHLIEQKESLPPSLREELAKVSHRNYTEGFFSKESESSRQHYPNSHYIRNYQFIGPALYENNHLQINVKASFRIGDTIEIIFPDFNDDHFIEVTEILDADGIRINEAKPNSTVKILLPKILPSYGIVRKKI
ncbi:MAG: U32 family peptidase [Candidatus Cloacimonetes bacterium]|nr:U32 family peptidase [Candidatus Cloacimonadota bacterium]